MRWLGEGRFGYPRTVVEGGVVHAQGSYRGDVAVRPA